MMLHRIIKVLHLRIKLWRLFYTSSWGYFYLLEHFDDHGFILRIKSCINSNVGLRSCVFTISS